MNDTAQQWSLEWGFFFSTTTPTTTTCLLRMAGVCLGCLDSTTSDREILFTASSPYEEEEEGTWLRQSTD